VDAADLAPIRLHHDPGAWALAARFGQPVYAEGNDVFFQKGAYNPGTVQGRNLLGRQLARTPAVRAAQRLRAAENAPAPSPAAPHASVAAPHAPVVAPHAPVAAPVPAPAHAPIVTAALPPGDADATIVAEWQALAAEPTYRLFASLLGADPLARRALPSRPPDEALATWLRGLAPGASPVNLATLRANGGLAQFVATLTREALAPGVLPLREALAADVAAFLADPTGWLTRAQRRGEAAPGLVVDPHAVPRQQAVEFFLLRITPHLRALARAAADQAALGAAYRASGMLSLRALGAVDHAAGARVLAVGQFDGGVVAVVQRGPNWWDLVVGGVVHRFEDAAGALAAQGLSALIAVGGPGAQQLVRAAGQDLGQILKDPHAFFTHLTNAIGGGFTLFARDLGGNLESGALQWLTGQGGLTLPALDAAGLLTFALETAGLSYASFTGDLETAFTRHHRDGAKLVAGLDTLYGYAPELHDLAAGGPGHLAALAGHLLREVKGLNIQALVFDQVKAVLGPQLLLQVAPTLVGYLIPGADVAEAVGAVVRIVGTIVSRAAQLEAFVATVFGALDTITRGKASDIHDAAGAIDGALKEAAPLVLAFASSLVGVDVSRIGASILQKLHAKEIVAALGTGLTKLADAIATLLLKAVPASVLARIEGHEGSAPAPAHPGQSHGGAAPTTPAVGTAQHTLHLVMEDAVAAVNAYAGKPVDEEIVRGVLAEVKGRHEGLDHLQLEPLAEKGYWAIRGSVEAPDIPAASPSPHQAHGIGLDASGDIAQGSDVVGKMTTADGVTEAAHRPGQGATHGHTVTETDPTKAEVDATPATEYTHQEDNGRASHVTVAPLTLRPPLGMRGLRHRPQASPPGWEQVLAFDDIFENPLNKSWQPRRWVKVHLWSDVLNGPGQKWNLVPGDKRDNKKMERGPEQRAKDALAEGIPALYYETRVTFRDANPYSGDKAVDWTNFPKEFRVTVATARRDGEGRWVKDKDLSGSPFVFDNLIEPPERTMRSALVDLNTASQRDIESLHLPTQLAREIADEDRDNPFDGEQDFFNRMKDRYNRLRRSVDFETKYWPKIKAIIDAGKATF